MGESKRLAERVFAKRKSELVENRFFDKRKLSKTKLSKLVELYLEVSNLKWSDLDFQNNLTVLSDTKSGKTREIPLNKAMREVLLSVPRHIKSDYVFCNQEGRPYTDIRRSFNSALKKAGIEDFTFHDLRHTFASHMVMSGIDINTLKEILGHSTITMTQRYAHLAPSFKQRSMQNIVTKQRTRKDLFSK